MRRLSLFAGCTWLLGGVALAQQPAAGLSRAREPVFSVRLFHAVDRENRPAAAPLMNAGPADFSRTGVRAEAGRTWDRARHSVDLGGAAQFSRAPARGGWIAEERWAAMRLQSSLSRRTTLTLSGRAGYAQAYAPPTGNTAQAVASNALIDVADLAVRGLASFTMTSAAGLSRTLTRRSSVLATYDFNRVAYAGGGVTIGNHRLGAAVTAALSRDWSVQAGYQSAWGETASARDTTAAYGHQVDVRTQYRLPFSRGTTVSGGVAPTLLGSRISGPGAPDAGGAGAFALQGQAGIDHVFGQALRIGAAYQRTASFPPGSVRPVLANAITARGTAAWGRRVTAQFSVSSARGTLSVRSLSAWTRADVRTSAGTWLYTEYAYESRVDGRGAFPLPGLDRTYTYRSLRVGVNIDFGLSGFPRRKA